MDEGLKREEVENKCKGEKMGGKMMDEGLKREGWKMNEGRRGIKDIKGEKMR